MKDKWRGFLLDIAISAAISGGASFVGYAIVQSIPETVALGAALSGAIVLFLPVVVVLVYGGPVIMVVNGLVKRRPGRIFGPLLLIAGLAAFSHITVALQRMSAEAADTRSISIDGAMPRTIALDEQSSFCLSPCIQVLATTNYDLVQRPNVERPWDRFQRVSGPQCSDDKHRRLTVTFLGLGFLGMCAEQVETDAKVDDAILIGWQDHARGDWFLSGRFQGEVAYVARIRNGTTTILGRWIEGRIEAPFKNFLGPLAPDSTKVGADIKMEEVYRAVSLRVLDSGRPGPAPIPALLDELVRLGDRKREGLGVSDAFKALLNGANDPIVVANYLAPMLESNDVEIRKLALRGLEVLKGKDLEFAKPALVKGLMSDDRDEAYRSAFILLRIPRKEREFAIDGLISATLKYVDEGAGQDLFLSLLSEAAHDFPDLSARLEGWTPANDRERRQLAKIKDLPAR